MPNLLSDVLGEAVARQPDLRLVPEPIRLPTVGAQVVARSIDTLVVASSHIEGRRLATQLAREVPRLTVVVVARDSQAIVVYHPSLGPSTVPDPSLDHFLGAIRQTQTAGRPTSSLGP